MPNIWRGEEKSAVKEKQQCTLYCVTDTHPLRNCLTTVRQHKAVINGLQHSISFQRPTTDRPFDEQMLTVDAKS